MKGITIATFISKNEGENKELYELIKYLKRHIEIETIIFSELKIEETNLKVIVTPKMTKYKRIQILLKEAKFNDILCIDNDVTPNKTNIYKFINECLNIDYSIAWGKIKAENIRGFIPKLIDIDKNLSHNYIRPTLWKLNIGISLPGQIFMINKKYLKNKLPDIDTVYDDLMIGATVRENKYPICFVKDILGYERPKKNIKELINQRIRWSKGLAETIIYNKKNKVLPYIILHGFSFNLLWIPVYIILFGLLKINSILGILSIALIAYHLTEKNIKNVIWAIIYMMFFPFVYLVWGISFVYNLIKICKKIRGKVNRKIWIKSLKYCYKKQANMLKKES